MRVRSLYSVIAFAKASSTRGGIDIIHVALFRRYCLRRRVDRASKPTIPPSSLTVSM